MDSRITSFGFILRWIGVNCLLVKDASASSKKISTADVPSNSMDCRTVVMGGL